MADFSIAFTEECWTDEGTSFRGLRLMMQDYTEGDQADLTSWSVHDYEKQWLSELHHLVEGREKGALITSIHDPAQAYRVWTWIMWKQNDVVLFQNRIMFMFEHGLNFDPMQISVHIGEYKSHSDDGSRLSEWAVPVSTIRSFLSKGLLCSEPS